MHISDKQFRLLSIRAEWTHPHVIHPVQHLLFVTPGILLESHNYVYLAIISFPLGFRDSQTLSTEYDEWLDLWLAVSEYC